MPLLYVVRAFNSKAEITTPILDPLVTYKGAAE